MNRILKIGTISVMITAITLISGCTGDNDTPKAAWLDVSNIVDNGNAGQITYVDITILRDNIVSEKYSIHENLHEGHRVHIGDQASLEARGDNFVGFCEDTACSSILTTKRTYITTIYSEKIEIYAVFRAPKAAQLDISNIATDNGQITYVDVTISRDNIVSKTYSIHENLHVGQRVHIGDQASLEARGDSFVGFCKDITCSSILTTERTYITTIYSEKIEIYAVFRKYYSNSE